MTNELINKEQFINLKALLESMARCSTKEDEMFCRRYKEEIVAFLEDYVR